MFSRKENLNRCCPNCGNSPSWRIVKVVDSNGKERFPYVCQSCGKRTQCFAKKKDVPIEIRNGDPAKTYHQKKGKCQRCGITTYLEEHHWAPWKYFEDADNWPKSMLCRACHEEWHQVMTGDLIHNPPLNRTLGTSR